MQNLREFIDHHRKRGQVIDIYTDVDPHLEIAEIHRRVVAVEGPILFFHNVKRSKFPVVTNLFGTKERVFSAFPDRPELWIQDVIKLATEKFPPSLGELWQSRSALKRLLKIGTKKRRSVPVQECQISPVDLDQLPMLTSWPEDGGAFLTLPLVYTESPSGKPPNLGMYRIQRFSKDETGLHIQIGKGGGFHFHEAEQKNQPLPVNIFLGGSPALILSAITPLPENVPELLLCSLLQGEKLMTTRSYKGTLPLIGECEFALVGEATPHIRKPEGPFGDHYGYYSLEHPFPTFKCKEIYHRKDAIFPATVVGKPRQEDFYIGEFLQELLSPLFPVVMPGVKALWSYGETGFHALSAAVVQERYAKEAMAHAFRILGEGQLSLTKFLLLTDHSLPLSDFRKVLIHILERFQPETDLFIFSNLSLDSLDYSGPKLNHGSKGVMLGLGEKKRTLPKQWTTPLPRPIEKCAIFADGCLVLQTPKYTEFQEFNLILNNPIFKEWPLIILTDDCEKTAATPTNFLWTVFTRFEPAADIHAQYSKIHRHHLCYTGPILIDARMKPTYPPQVLCDEITHALVTKRWNEYFPQKQPMGNSLSANVY